MTPFVLGRTLFAGGLILLVGGVAWRSHAQLTAVNTPLPGLTRPAVAWGDFDADGDLDLAIAGETNNVKITRIYRNDAGQLSDANAGLTGLRRGALAWGDYDGDNDLDLVVSGEADTGRLTRLYRNDRGQFVDSGATLIGLDSGAVAWGDYDNDGDLDLVLAGSDGINPVTQLYLNQRGNFTAVATGLPGTSFGSVAWGDYDGDGDLDLVMAGRRGGSLPPVCRVFRNTMGQFADSGVELPGISEGTAIWGDYDSDGDLDLALIGRATSGGIAEIYRNDQGTFVAANAGLIGLTLASAAWADFDHDGDLDLATLGRDGSNAATILYRNDAGRFARVTTGLRPLNDGAVAWGDYDGNGALDLLLAGTSTADNRGATVLYRNGMTVSNTPPSVPMNLASAPIGLNVTLLWSMSTDVQTPGRALTYNLLIGTNTGGSDLIAPHSIVATGQRLLPSGGNANTRLVYRVFGLRPGVKYYWSVQAVDSGLATSPFAPEAEFMMVQPGPSAILYHWRVPMGYQLTFIGPPGFVHGIEVSPDFTNWTRVDERLANSTGFFEWTDTAPFTAPRRFYRAVFP